MRTGEERRKKKEVKRNGSTGRRASGEREREENERERRRERERDKREREEERP